MSGMTLLIRFELVGSIGYHLISLHEDTTKTMFRGNAIDLKLPSPGRKSENRGGGEAAFQCLKGFFAFGGPLKF